MRGGVWSDTPTSYIIVRRETSTSLHFHDARLAVKLEFEASPIGRDQGVGFTVGRELASTMGTPAHSIAQAVTTKHERSTTRSTDLVGGLNLRGATRPVEVSSTLIGNIGKIGEGRILNFEF